MQITVNEFPLGEGGRPKAGGWIRLAEAESSPQRHPAKVELGTRSFAASILHLWCAPSPRDCLLRFNQHFGPCLYADNRQRVPPWRRGTAKGRGMDPPRRGGIFTAEASGESRAGNPQLRCIHPAPLVRPFSKGLHAYGSIKIAALYNLCAATSTPHSSFLTPN